VCETWPGDVTDSEKGWRFFSRCEQGLSRAYAEAVWRSGISGNVSWGTWPVFLGVQFLGGNLEITVSRAELAARADRGAVRRRAQDDHSDPVELPLRSRDDKLTITATDLDQSLKTSCAAKVKKPGACTIPARKLYDYIKLLPEGDISIKLMDNHWVQIRAGRSNTKMVGMARANFPQVPEFPERRVQDQRRLAEEHDREDDLRDLERRVALHAERRAAGAEGGVDGDGRDRRPPAGAHREAGEALEGISGEKKTLIPRKALASCFAAGRVRRRDAGLRR
jgi:DNA polymerase-3 subunit beta